MSDYLPRVTYRVKKEYSQIDSDYRGIFWIVFSFLISLVFSKWSWGLLFLIGYAGALVVGKTILDTEHGSDLNTKLIFIGSILTSILGYVLGRALLWGDRSLTNSFP